MNEQTNMSIKLKDRKSDKTCIKEMITINKYMQTNKDASLFLFRFSFCRKMPSLFLFRFSFCRKMLHTASLFLFLFLFLFRWNYDPCYSTSLGQGFIDGRNIQSQRSSEVLKSAHVFQKRARGPSRQGTI